MKKRYAAAVFAIDFYVLPLLVNNTGSAMFMLLCVVPLLAFGSAVAYGALQGFDLRLPLIAVALFIPTIFLFYNESAWVYTLIYGAAVVLGNLIGKMMKTGGRA